MFDGDFLSGKSIPPFAALRAFEVVGRAGGIRRAASLLSLDHTVVSRHLRTLEEWLGVALFDRENGKITLTETGRAYHARISAALLDMVSATREVVAHGKIQDLHLWCVPGFAAQWLSDQLAAFERQEPGFSVELRPTDQPANLLQFEADIDIRFYGDDWLPKPGGAGLQSLELARPPLLVVASPEMAAQAARLAHVSELVGAPLLHEEHQEQWRAWLSRNGVAVPARLPGPLLWHAHLAIGAARQGRGLALANRYLVQQDIDSGALVEVNVPGGDRQAIGSYCLVTRADRWSNPAIARLRAFLKAQTS